MSAPAGPFLPTGALVATAWLSQRVPGVTAAQVATSLPRDVAAWADEGFVQVTMVPSAAPTESGATRVAYAQVDCWGVNVASDGGATGKPARLKATRLAELVFRATDDDVQRGFFGLPVTMPANYLPARVLAVYPQTEPTEVRDDPNGFGRVTLDLAFSWARL